MYGLEKHHIVFRSQGGLDFEYNYAYLTPEEHKGNEGPHKSRDRDLELKKHLQVTLQSKLQKKFYTVNELIEVLNLKKVQAIKICRKLTYHKEGYERQEIIRRLMGGKLY